jgi:hypothetical protein
VTPAPGGSPAPERTGAPPPEVVLWPVSVIDATISLAALDNEVKRAGADLIVGSQRQDVELMLGAAFGLARIARESIPNAERLTTYPVTADVGRRYVPVLARIDSAATLLGQALLDADPDGVEAASGYVAAAMAAYGEVRPDLVELADIALTMRRGLLVK